MSLADWLSYQERLHPKPIDLGLERLERMLTRLEWCGLQCPVITVGGTNGKGSCVALLEAMLSAGGYRVGVFTSPHLVRYNERIRIAGREATDAELMAAFERIETARGDVSLTFFEFNTLAALLNFADARLDAVVLEVGMGGRFDAVNVIDADAAIVTSIALDHCEWLGYDLESIAHNKAGIFRPRRPAIFGARAMPEAIAREASRIGACLRRLGVDFEYARVGDGWRWWSREQREWRDLPPPALVGAVQFDNAATVLAALDCLQDRLPLGRAQIEHGLRAVTLAGRFQTIRDARPGEWILDVAHNPAAAAVLAQCLRARPAVGETLAICGIFGDKDVEGVLTAMESEIDAWILATVSGPRALPASVLADKIRTRGGRVLFVAEDVAAACAQARSLAGEQDRVVVFGSFHTVGPALEWLGDRGVGKVG